MADLIDRAALLEQLDDLHNHCGHCDGYGYISKDKAMQKVKAAPAVDAVEVVRCCKCKHYNLQLTGAGSETMCCTINAEYDEDVGVWYGLTSYTPPEFYCADGERRTDADN